MSVSTDPREAMARLLAAPFLMTSQYEGERAGVIVRSVQFCNADPPLLCVAVRTGHQIEPLIRDSRGFALSQVAADDRLVLKKFDPRAGREPGDPFDAIGLRTMQSGSPALSASSLVFDCEVVRHFDLEADCELYIGQVLACRSV